MSAAGEPALPARSVDEIRDWIVARLARILEIDIQEINPQAPIASYGVDSVQLVLFVTDLEQWLNVRFTENPLNESISVDLLAQRLCDRRRQP